MDSDLYAVADFCLLPIGTANPSVAEYIAECQRVLEKSGLTYQLHGYGTNLGDSIIAPKIHVFLTSHPEGSWSQVSKAIHDCHVAVHAKGAPRVATDIRIGTRMDRSIVPGTGNELKIKRVEDILARDPK